MSVVCFTFKMIFVPQMLRIKKNCTVKPRYGHLGDHRGWVEFRENVSAFFPKGQRNLSVITRCPYYAGVRKSGFDCNLNSTSSKNVKSHLSPTFIQFSEVLEDKTSFRELESHVKNTRWVLNTSFLITVYCLSGPERPDPHHA